jgi:hypothetical protein
MNKKIWDPLKLTKYDYALTKKANERRELKIAIEEYLKNNKITVLEPRPIPDFSPVRIASDSKLF